MVRLWWRRYLLVGGVVVICYPFVPAGVPQDVAYLAVGLSCVAAILVGVRRHRPVRSAPWYLMALGQLLWVVGDGVDSWHLDIAHDASFPSAADAFYLSAYPVLAVGLLLLIRGRVPRRDLAGFLDSTTVTTGLGLLSWVLLAGPTIAASENSFATAAVGAAYPIADILLVGLLIRLITTPGGRTPSLRLLFAAVTLLIAGDTTSAAVNLLTPGTTSVYELVWLGSYLAWGAAALHPSMTSLSASTTGGDSGFSRYRLAALTAAILIAPGTLAVQKWIGSELDVWPVVIGSIVMFLLVVARMWVAIDQIVAANRVRERLQDELAHQASHDSLTQLPNRAEALRLVEQALYRAQRSGTMIGLLFVDLDKFKAVNDRFGHGAGDDVLLAVARRMQANVRGGDVVARLGGDEFVVVLEPVDTESSAVEVAYRLILAVSAPILTRRGDEVQVGASVGVAISADGLIEPERVLHEADAAVYRAKSAGRGRVEVFDHVVRQELADRTALEKAIIQALRDEEFSLMYQPVVELATGCVREFEALLRWDRPDSGPVPPADFIPTAELSDLICQIDQWVLARALGQLTRWQAAPGGADNVKVAVKIAGRHLTVPGIVEEVAAALSNAGVVPTDLILEINEVVLQDELIGLQNLEALRELGVIVAVEHFGTGGQWTRRLHTLPIDVIKTDPILLSSSDPNSRRLLRLLIYAAHTFGKAVTAAGIENQSQVDELRDLGCEFAQGFHFGQPMNPTDALECLARATIEPSRAG